MFYVVAFDPIKTRYAPQNYRWHLSFVKDVYAVGKKMTKNVRKLAICMVSFFQSDVTMFAFFKKIKHQDITF